MSTSESMLKRSMRPRTRSLIRGWVTPSSFGGFRLRHAPVLDEIADCEHEGGANLQVCRLLFVKAEIEESVAAGRGDLLCALAWLNSS